MEEKISGFDDLSEEELQKWKVFGLIVWQQKKMRRLVGEYMEHVKEMYPNIHVQQLVRMQDIMEACGSYDRADMADMLRYTGDSPQLLSRMLRTLEGEGLVERHSDPEDRRRTYVKLTDYGKEMLLKCLQIILDYNKDIILHMEYGQLKSIQEDMDILLGMMEKFIQ